MHDGGKTKTFVVAVTLFPSVQTLTRYVFDTFVHKITKVHFFRQHPYANSGSLLGPFIIKVTLFIIYTFYKS